MRKIAIFCVILVLAAVFGGCFSLGERSGSADITVWHWMSDRHEAFLDLARQYKEKTGVRVRFELFPHSAYSQKINAAAAAKDLPDLFGILGEKRLFASYIKEGLIQDLTPYMQEGEPAWRDGFIDIALDFNSFKENNIYNIKEGVYGVPIDFMSIQFLYNRKLLEEAGYKAPPETWESFISVAKDISQDKDMVEGFVAGWGENWYIHCLATVYAFDIMGEDKFFATMRGEVPYTDSDWIKIFSLFSQMEKNNILAADIVTMNNKESEHLFSTERAVFSFNGSWGINTYKQMNPDLEYATMAPPSVSGKYSPKIWAGAGSSFVVSAFTPDKAKVINFLKWLTEKEQQLYLIEETKNLPAVKGLEDKISPSMAHFLDNQQYFTHPRLWQINEKSRVIEAINIGIQQIIIGEENPEKIAKNIQAVKERN
jgi:ABC-type glycerol-3-phosphate transport system substrate-binding protein